jgi:MFS family permease
MIRIAISIFSLLLGTALLLNGIGLLGTLVGLRATAEGFSVVMIGAVMSAYFLGFAIGSWFCPVIIRRVGHIRAFAAFATLASAAAIAYPLFVEPFSWFLLRALTGLTLAGLFMSIESWLNVIAPNQIRGQLFSLYTAITLLSMGTGQFLLLFGNIAGYDLFAIFTILISFSILPIVLTHVSQPAEVKTPKLSFKRLISISPLGLVTSFMAGVISSGFWGMGPVFAEHISNVAIVNDLLAADEVLEATRGLLMVYGIGAAIGPLLAAQFMQVFGNIHLLGFFALNLLVLSVYTMYRLFVGKSVSVQEQAEFVPMVRTSNVVLDMAPQLNDEEHNADS